MMKNYVKDNRSGAIDTVVKNKDINRAIVGEALIEVFDGDKRVIEAHTENLLTNRAIWSMFLKQFLKQNYFNGDALNAENVIFGNLLLTNTEQVEDAKLAYPVGKVLGFCNLQSPHISDDVKEGTLTINSNSFISKKFTVSCSFGVEKAIGAFNTIWLTAPYPKQSQFNGSFFNDFKRIASVPSDIGEQLVAVKNEIYKVFQNKVEVYTLKRGVGGDFNFRYIKDIPLGKTLATVDNVAYNKKLNILGIASNLIVYLFDATTLRYLDKSLKVKSNQFSFTEAQIVTPSTDAPCKYLAKYDIASLTSSTAPAETGTGGTSTITNETGAFTPSGVVTSNLSYKNAYKYISLFQQWGNTYGIDPYLLLAISCQESSGDHYGTLPGGSRYNSAGVGLMQIEKPGEVTTGVSAYNHNTKSMDYMPISGAGAVTDVGDNIRAGAMMFATKVKAMSYNVLLCLQGYNYGSGGISAVINLYSNASGKTSAQIKADSSDTGWMAWRDEVHNNPSAYFSWGGGTYGDPNYVENVLKNYASPDNTIPYAVKEDGIAGASDGTVKSGFEAGSGSLVGGTEIQTETNCMGYLQSNYDNTILYITSYLFLEGSGLAPGSNVLITLDKDLKKISQVTDLEYGRFLPIALNMLDTNCFYYYGSILKSYVASGTQTKLASTITKESGKSMKITYTFTIT